MLFSDFQRYKIVYVLHIPNLLFSYTLPSESVYQIFMKHEYNGLCLWALLCAKVVHMASATWILLLRFL